MKSPHNLNVEGLERVTSRLDKVDACMNAVIDNVHAVDLVLGIKVGIETLLNVVDNWAPGLVVVDKVTETRGIDNGKTQADTIFLKLGGDGLDGDSLGNNVGGRTLLLLGGV